jgi:hypothetical protein
MITRRRLAQSASIAIVGSGLAGPLRGACAAKRPVGTTFRFVHANREGRRPSGRHGPQAPIIIAAYLTKTDAPGEQRNAALADVARAIAAAVHRP